MSVSWIRVCFFLSFFIPFQLLGLFVRTQNFGYFTILGDPSLIFFLFLCFSPGKIQILAQFLMHINRNLFYTSRKKYSEVEYFRTRRLVPSSLHLTRCERTTSEICRFEHQWEGADYRLQTGLNWTIWIVQPCKENVFRTASRAKRWWWFPCLVRSEEWSFLVRRLFSTKRKIFSCLLTREMRISKFSYFSRNLRRSFRLHKFRLWTYNIIAKQESGTSKLAKIVGSSLVFTQSTCEKRENVWALGSHLPLILLKLIAGIYVIENPHWEFRQDLRVLTDARIPCELK